MNIDATLSSATRMVIIDAKYYRDALQTHHDSQKVHSGHLYQLLAYLRGSNVLRDPEQVLEGMLVYPVGDRAVDLRFTIDGFPIRIYTLNLAQPWYWIEADLLNLIGIPNTQAIQGNRSSPVR